MMKVAFKNSLIYNDKNEVCGINLGSDYTGEHERGLRGIYQTLGVDDTTFEIANRKITKINSEDVIFKDTTIEGVKYSLLLYVPDNKGRKITKTVIYNYELNPFDGSNRDFYCAWDENSFGILTEKSKYGKFLKELYNAILNKDCCVVILPGENDKFNDGLSLIIYSKKYN